MEKRIEGEGEGQEALPSRAVSRSARLRLLLAYDGYNLATNATLSSAVWMIYLARHGYSPLAIGLLEMTLHVTKLCAEIPTGIYADLLGRRRSLLIYCVLSAAAMLGLVWPLGPLVVLSFVLWGLAFAFRGGAEEALLWGLARRLVANEDQQQRYFSRLISRMYLLALVAEAASTGAGGLLGQVQEALPFLVQAALAVLAMLPLLALPEERGSTQRQPLRHLLQGLQAVRGDRVLVALLALAGLVEGCGLTIYYYHQLYLVGLGLTLAQVGLVIAASQVISFGCTALAPALLARLRQSHLLVGLLVALAGGLLLMSLPLAPLSLAGFLVLFQGAYALWQPVVSTWLNERSPEAQRATVLSLQTGLFSAAMVTLFPLFGLGVGEMSYRSLYRSLALLASTGLLLASLRSLLGRRRRGLRGSQQQSELP
ncbi:MFS transporter [Thermogemmatispora carboxidivorans]|uniref:MFS transporter n=1 Tax=Thermogemmatispora carboxidivorans TaxID=1382306 RepID=UPI00069C853C|nr:MFS transporter [Thermogemmatispora carboxidivorans]